MPSLQTSATQFNLTLSDSQLEQFESYFNILSEWNQRINLTRIISREDVYSKHFLDSLSCLLALPTLPAHVIDVGAGAGFPGVVLKIAQPHIQLTLVEATQKKATFLRHLVEALALAQVTVVAERIETVGQDKQHRAKYDLAVARAVAAMPVLAEYMLPLLRLGGVMLAQKGVDPAAEVQAAAQALRLLGGRHRQTLPVTVPDLEAARHLVLIDKVAATPRDYPRRPGLPAKNPLSNENQQGTPVRK